MFVAYVIHGSQSNKLFYTHTHTHARALTYGGLTYRNYFLLANVSMACVLSCWSWPITVTFAAKINHKKPFAFGAGQQDELIMSECVEQCFDCSVAGTIVSLRY